MTKFTYFTDKNCSLVIRRHNYKLLNSKKHDVNSTCEKNQMITAMLTDAEIEFFKFFFKNCVTKNHFYRFKTLQNLPPCWTYFETKPNKYPKKTVKCNMLNKSGSICKVTEKYTKFDYSKYILSGIGAFLFTLFGASVIVYIKFKKVFFK